MLSPRSSLVFVLFFTAASLVPAQTRVERLAPASSRNIAALQEVKQRLASLPPPSTLFASPTASGVLSVVRAEWGAGVPTPAAEATGSSAAPEPAFDLAAAGLKPGMSVDAISEILGPPAVRVQGLAGAGFDEKAHYRLPSGWRIIVAASGGQAQYFVSVRD